jgi:hypothetical protein
MKAAPRVPILALALLAGACTDRACGGLGGMPPAPLPMVKQGNREFYLLDRGRYKAFYDTMGRLDRIEYDSNGDGRGDYIVHYDASGQIGLVEVDEDFDGWIDRWEYYDAKGVLEKVGRSRRGRQKPDVWTFPGPQGRPSRIEYDEDGDGKVDRVEILRDGQVVKVEIDSDRDGRMDRWQTWEGGRLRSEELDTKGTGRPDRRIVYDARGSVLRVERLPP